MSNVVVFPKTFRDTPPQSLEEVVEKVRVNQVTYADCIANRAGVAVLDMLTEAGYNLTPELSEDVMLMLDSITSLYYKAGGNPHSLQDYARDVYEISDKEAFIDSFYEEFYEDI